VKRARKAPRTTRPADPFGPLLGHRAPVLPAVPSCTVVVAGEKLRSTRDLRRLVLDDELADADTAKARELAAELRRARKRASDKAYREANREKAKAWAQANPERMREYRRKYREDNRDAVLQQMAEWKRQQYHADPETARAKARANYHANREKILEQTRARRAAAREARQAAQQVQP
jgi:hypothetical protein